MNIQFKNSINNFALTFLMFFAMFLFGFGCNTPKTDPLEGFHVSDIVNLDSNKVITDDYQSYLRTLPPEEQKFARVSGFFEDGTGQHAVKIEIALNGTWWNHILIYSKDNKRIKVIKYSPGKYRS